MGRNPKPLRILVLDQTIHASEAIQRFRDKGHEIAWGDLVEREDDVIIGPRCWRIDPQLKLGQDATVEESLERQLEMMEKGVRAIKYPKEKKDATENKA